MKMQRAHSVRCRWCALLAAGAATTAGAQGAAPEAVKDLAPAGTQEASTRPLPGIDGLSDPLVEAAIESELWEARAVDANDIDVDVTRGIVTLTGTVDNVLQSDRAVRIARLTRGVTSVINRLQAAESGRPDETIEGDVEAALATDPATDSWEIFTSVTSGNVTLSGAVQSNAERRLAERVAKSVSGVRSVDNTLRIDVKGTRADAEIAAEIRELLDWDVRLDTRLVAVDVMGGEVALSGAIASDFERDLATAIAWVAGVTAVDASELEIEWWRRDAMQRDRPPTAFTDMQVREAIGRALSLDPRLSPFHVETSVHDGTAVLRGVVDNLKARRVAAQAARNTVGVTRVANYLKVRPEIARGDAELANDVRAALARDVLLEADDIVVDVDGGLVRLSGTVVSPFERAQAADVVARVNGVTSVGNGLRITYDGPNHAYEYGEDPLLHDYDYDRDYDYAGVYGKSDAQIENEIREELFWSPNVDADDVRVSVEDGVATLRGRVDDVFERRKAVENALEGGAYRVRDEIGIGP